MEAIGKEAAGESSTTTIGIVTTIGTTGGTGSTIDDGFKDAQNDRQTLKGVM